MTGVILQWQFASASYAFKTVTLLLFSIDCIGGMYYRLMQNDKNKYVPTFYDAAVKYYFLQLVNATLVRYRRIK